MLTARIWREQRWRYRNDVARCTHCGAMHYPPRALCDQCGRRNLELRRMAETGTVLTFTVIRVAPPTFVRHVPYAVAVLEMEDGTRLMAQVADIDPEQVKIGMKVRLEFRKIREQGRPGVIAYGHKAVPLEA